MKNCSFCGAEIPDSEDSCKKCGKGPEEGSSENKSRESVNRSTAEEVESKMRKPLFAAASSMSKKVANRIKFEYTSIPKDKNEKVVQALQTLFINLQNKRMTAKNILEEAGMLLIKHFGLKDVVIGVKDPRNNLFKHEVVIGCTNEVKKTLKNLTYQESDFYNPEKWKPVKISKCIHLYLSEEQSTPEEEVSTFNRPLLLQRERKTTTQLLEGDYVDFLMFGHNDELIGYIELSGEKGGELPSNNTIKWVELIASMLAIILENERAHRELTIERIVK